MIDLKRIALVALLALAACSTDPPEPPPDGARPRTVTTDAGSELEALELGRGGHVVVFSHGATGTKEDFYELAQGFADAGWRAIVYDASGVGDSTGERDQDREGDLRAVVEQARSTGAETLVLGGGSMGASLSIATAAELEADAVISLSASTTTFDALEAASALRGEVPMYVAAAEGNEPFGEEARRIAEASATTATIVDGDGHGTGILSDHPELIDAIVTFADEATERQEGTS
ncbi:MAG: alpha/beta fold hydrolase [Actinomycetota bacterium]